MNIKHYFYYFFLLIFLLSCASSEEIIESADPVFYHYRLDENSKEDEAMALYIEPYVREMAGRMNRVLTISEGSFQKQKPEGALGNLSADIVRYRATNEMGKLVHVSIINNGGLRAPLSKGEITVGDIYELMPFENHIAVLRFSGKQLVQIADELASVNGEAVSGIRFRIDDGKARDILVDSKNVKPEAYYWVATNNWMADGGGASATLWEPLERRDLDVLIRDAIIDYLRQKESIEPYVDQRIRN